MLWLSRYVHRPGECAREQDLRAGKSRCTLSASAPYSVVSTLPMSSFVGYTLPVGCPASEVTSRYSTDLNCLCLEVKVEGLRLSERAAEQPQRTWWRRSSGRW